MKIRLAIVVATAFCIGPGAPSQAQQRQPNPNAKGPSDADLARHITVGPANITLGPNIASLKMPAGFLFEDKELANMEKQQNGERPNPNMLGIVGTSAGNDTAVVLKYEDRGYIKDDEADK